ncbi:MAG: 1,4-dihydroxy-2-naphthoate octaprenyltransferase [Bacteroidaceae bacterium]|nr:1,4-dihydroxy-2-naphthoate octaprenyltransferase [Prevotellaceae bacterium]MDY5632848.1 1,4-dihydroxy-2-naphthoate octaprenyltransferase [Bacteroidaceae bacterium]
MKEKIALWIGVMRPKTLTGAMAPVMLSLAAAYHDGHWQWVPALLCLGFALLMQMAANAVNDLVDGLKGRDGSNRLGPQRALSAGLVTARQLKRAIAILFFLAALCGLPLIYYGGPWMLVVGLTCAAFCVLYSTLLAQLGLGDLLVILFFGLVPVTLTYYLQTGTITFSVLLLSLGMGLATDVLLVVNNYRDIHEDRANGKRTLCVLLGERGSLRLYLFLGIAASLLAGYALYLMHVFPWIVAVYLWCHGVYFILLRRMPHTPAMNEALGNASRNIFLYALLITAVLLVR